jgi:hypothetical protein
MEEYKNMIRHTNDTQARKKSEIGAGENGQLKYVNVYNVKPNSTTTTT